MQSCQNSSRSVPNEYFLPSPTSSIKSNIPSEGKYIPNFTTISNSWDVRHLDKFLNRSEYAKNSPPASVRVPASPKVLSPKGSTTSVLSLAAHKKGSASIGNSPATKGSHFMRNDGRDSDIQKKEYMLNIYRDFGSKGANNDFNTMAIMSGINPDAAKNYFARCLTPQNKQFNPAKLEPAKQVESPLMSPKQRRQEIDEIKANRMEFQKWSDNKKEMTKLNRICKNGFRSGILGLDSPLNPQTTLFKEEKQKFELKVTGEQVVEERRVNQLVKIGGTSPSVEFLNLRFNEEDIKPPVRIAERNIKKTVDSPHVKTWQDSNKRLFGDVQQNVSEKRRNFLVEMDTRGKDWDIISAKLHNKKV